jgi:outer membrane receptor protein involved in Fe transport
MGSVPRVKSFMATVRREFTPTIELFTEFSTASNIGVTVYDPLDTNAGLFVPVSSPANPFNQDVSVSFPNTLVTPFLTDSVTQSVTLGLLARLPGDWKSELDYTWSRNAFEFAFNSYDTGAFNSDLASGTINPFVDTLAHPLNLAPYLSSSTFAGRSTLNDLGLRASGPVGSLPWGHPTLTIGVEHRKEGNADSDQYIAYPLTPANNFHRLYFGQSQSTDSVYTEAQIPLVTAKNALPVIRSLDLQLAGRSERYTVNAGTPFVFLSPVSFQRFNPPQGVRRMIEYTSTNPTMGLKYKPVDDLTFRVSYAKAFLPPTFSQLLPNPTPSIFTINVTDPRNGQTYRVHEIQGGNPNLNPQTARDWDLGVIWEPTEDVLRGVRMDLEYYHITQPDYIAIPAAQQVVSNPGYASRVTRDPTSGRITVVDVSPVNATEFQTSGWDLTIDYRKPTSFGTFDLHALGTVIEHDRRQYTVGGASLDYVGFPSEAGEGKTKANLSLSWEHWHWTLGWTTTYYGSYLQTGSPGSPSALQSGPATVFTDAQGGYTIPSQTYHAIFGSYGFGKTRAGLLSSLTIQFGIKNLFNKLPPVDAFYEPYYYSPYGDPRLREYSVSIKKAF